MSTLWLLSEQGVLTLENNPVKTPFGNRPVIAGNVSQEGEVGLIVDGNEVWTYANGEWRLAATSEVRLNCIAWTPQGRWLVGTERARLAWVESGTIQFIESFDAVPERPLWKTPWGGPPDTRSLAVAADGTVYANIHVGWIVRSTDGGQTWQNLRGLEMDVHQVAAHPSDATIVFAATARGFFFSNDQGSTFQQRAEGMPYLYQRACACFPDRSVYLVTTSRGPHGQADALLYWTHDEGRTWRLAEGLPESISQNIDTFQVTPLAGGQAWTIVENTHLYRSEDWGMHWEAHQRQYPRLYQILAV